MLMRGSKGHGVRRLQAMLTVSGFNAKPIDGDFGPGTQGALQRYQRAMGLPQSGQVDGQTERAIGLDKPDIILSVVPVLSRITEGDVVRMFATATPRHNIQTHLPVVLAALGDAGLDDADMALMALGTIRAETEGFEPINEKPSVYNTSGYGTPAQGHPFDLYDFRSDLGNRGVGDGDRFKGRGFIQLTGRDNYQNLGRQMGLGTRLEDNPHLANDPKIAAQILSVFIKNKRTEAKYAIFADDLTTARKLVNGGSHGLDRFTAAFTIGRRLYKP